MCPEPRWSVRARPTARTATQVTRGRVERMSFSHLSHLECSRTGARYEADQVQGVSAVGAPLLARYDLDAVRASVTPAEIAARPHDLWRYHEVLPVRDPAHVTTLGEGMTPLLPLPSYGAHIGVPGPADEGRGAGAHRQLQGPRRGRRRVPGPRARRAGGRDAHERQRRGRLVGLRRPRRAGLADRDAGRRPGDHPARVRRVRCRALPRRRPDQPRRRPGQGRGRRAARDPGGLDAQGALPHRGQEDDGLRDRRAARLARART